MSAFRFRPPSVPPARLAAAFALLVAALGLAALTLLPTEPLPSGARAPTVAAEPTSAPATGIDPGAPVPSYEETSPSLASGGGPGWADVVGLIARLALVLGLLVLLLKGLQRLSGRRGRALSGKRAIELLETMPIAQGTTLYLVAVGGRVLLLGGTSQHIGLLAQLEEPALFNRLAPSGDDSTDPGGLLEPERPAR